VSEVKWAVIVILAVGIVLLAAIATASGSNPSMPVRIKRLEQKTKNLEGRVRSLEALVIALQEADQNAAEAESNLSARVDALEQTVYGRR
jgi:outer membrane murein-binding lipoprotein Lpp